MKEHIVVLEIEGYEDKRFYFECDATDANDAQDQAINGNDNTRCIAVYERVS